jgi:hypothetical protein
MAGDWQRVPKASREGGDKCGRRRRQHAQLCDVHTPTRVGHSPTSKIYSQACVMVKLHKVDKFDVEKIRSKNNEFIFLRAGSKYSMVDLIKSC